MTKMPIYLIPIACTVVVISLLAHANCFAQGVSGQRPAPWDVEVVPSGKKSVDRSNNVEVSYNKIVRTTVYVTSFCHECEQLVEYLDIQKIKYKKEYLVAGANVLADVVGLGIKPPTVKFEYRNGESRKVVGFDRKVLDTIIDSEAMELEDSFALSEFDIRGTSK